MNTVNDVNKIKIIPKACPVYSLGLMQTGVKPLVSVKVTGISEPRAHRVSFNIYGMSKAGFFIERTAAFSGELYAERDKDGFLFDFTRITFRLRQEFFRGHNFKSPVNGKLYVEADIDGVKYMGSAAVTLLPSCVYPSKASPVVFASYLAPCNPEIERICQSQDRSLRGIYDALRKERIIYSVKDCDFISKDTVFENVGSIFIKRSKMASPFEMAMIYCSCALRAGLLPVFAVLKSKKPPRILCGAISRSTSFGMISGSSEDIRKLCYRGELSLFDISCLFTGHTVEYDDALKNALDEVMSSEIIFALDIAEALKAGVAFCFPENGNDKFIDNIKKNLRPVNMCPGLPEYAEMLSDTEKSPLLITELMSDEYIPVRFSDFSEVQASALKSERIVVSESSEQSSVISGMGMIYDKYRYIKMIDGGKDEIYLACGFLYDGSCAAPIALYPVKLSSDSGRVYIKFMSPKPYCNRLLCEKLKGLPGFRGFFEKYGIPGGNLGSIISCFESICSSVPGDYRVIKECAAGVFPYKNSVLSFYIVDKYDKIRSDRLSAALLSSAGRTYDADIKGDYDRQICSFAAESPDIFPDVVYKAAAYAADGDIMVTEVCAEHMVYMAAETACRNIRLGHKTVIISENPELRRDICEYMKSIGLDNAVLEISRKSNIKKTISQKLVSLSETKLNGTPDNDVTELNGLSEKLLRYTGSKKRIYDFEFSFDDAVKAYINAGNDLNAEERNTVLEPESIFFPDISKSSTEKLFSSQMKLCRAAAVLNAASCEKNAVGSSAGFFKESNAYSAHPLHSVKRTKEWKDTDAQTFAYLSERCLNEFREFSSACTLICENTGFKASDIKTLSALHSFLSLIVFISKEYDSKITEDLLLSDIYAESKKLSELREIADSIIEKEAELCEFEEDIYELEGGELLDKWNESEDYHTEIAKKVNGYRKLEDTQDADKKSIPEILRLLHDRSQLLSEFSENSIEMSRLFAGAWDNYKSNWDKIFKYVDFVKSAVVLLKKIYGTDSEQRSEAAKLFPAISEYCSDKLNMAGVLNAAGSFDRMFSDDGQFMSLSEKISADIYGMSFAEGIFSENGMEKILRGWNIYADLIPDAVEYNRCAAECEKYGLGCFVRYFDDHPYTQNAGKIFIRSLLLIAMKQIALYDKTFMEMTNYDSEVSRYSQLLEERCLTNRKTLVNRYIDSCVAYINSNPEKSAAFSESLSENSFTSEELILRYGETIKAVFPVIITEPAFAGLLSDFENAVIPESDLLPVEKAIPILWCARHKLILSGVGKMNENSLAAACARSGVPSISALISDGNLTDIVRHMPEITYLRTPVSDFNKENGTNVLEAQTIGLEIMKMFEESPEKSAGIITFTENQRGAVEDVLSAVSEKSLAVSKAISGGRISVSCAMQGYSGKCDVLYVSTVYDRDDVSCSSYILMNIKNESKNGGLDYSLPYPSYRALLSRADKIIFVSSLMPESYPDFQFSVGMESMFLLADSVYGNGKNISKIGGGLYAPLVLEFCRLMSENGFEVKTQDGFPVVSAGGKDYGIIIGDKGFNEAYKAKILEEKGLKAEFVGSSELILNPNKVISRIKSLEEEAI